VRRIASTEKCRNLLIQTDRPSNAKAGRSSEMLERIVRTRSGNKAFGLRLAHTVWGLLPEYFFYMVLICVLYSSFFIWCSSFFFIVPCFMHSLLLSSKLHSNHSHSGFASYGESRAMNLKWKIFFSQRFPQLPSPSIVTCMYLIDALSSAYKNELNPPLYECLETIKL
jgi:hypothetical protein